MATILVVDDRPPNREVLITLLESKGHRLLQAGDAHEALALVRAEQPELVLCDILMPVTDGYEFVRQLRADPAIADTRVVLCSAHYRSSDADPLARQAGVHHVLAVPYVPQELFRVVDEALQEEPSLEVPIAASTADYDREHLRLVTSKLFDAVHELRQSNHRLHALVTLTLQLLSLREPAKLLDEMCRGACALIGARQCTLAVRDLTPGSVTQHATRGVPNDVAMRLGDADLQQGVLATVVAGRRPTRRQFEPSDGGDGHGLPEGFPTVRSLLAAPIASPHTVYGWICLTNRLGAEAFSDEDEQLLSLLGELVGRGYESGSLYLKMKRHAAEQVESLSWRLVDAQESERRQLSRELHDRVGQNLTALGINLDILRSQGAASDPPDMRARLDDSIELVEATAGAIENVMAELRPPMLDDHGLLAALQWYASQFAQRTGIEVMVQGDDGSPRRDLQLEITLFRIAQEALNNVAKHARANRVDIALHVADADFTLAVTDDGVGFDPTRVPPSAGRGMATMRERAQSAGGRFEVAAAPGAGTRVSARVRLPS